MGSVSNIISELKCPHCKSQIETEVEFKTYSEGSLYKVGDKLSDFYSKDKPPSYTIDDGYVECPECYYDFFVKIIINDQTIDNIILNTEKAGLISLPPQEKVKSLTELAQLYQMIKILKNGDKASVTEVVEHLIENNWLYDGTLRGIDLSGADLSQQMLSGADLQGVNFENADLTGVTLGTANLTWANLRSTNLSFAYLCDANLFGANLTNANLEGIDLNRSRLHFSNFRDSNLREAKSLYHAMFINADLIPTRKNKCV